ncbi:hypothetical protein PQR34_32045 [Paraburkholderia sediminicola]|uniref:hypothetical protein n=1 Tax=Paraburkholderia sediminicola TaxID=458836 RepID=UPI0038B8BC5C
MPDTPCFRVSLDVRVIDQKALYDAAQRCVSEPGTLLSAVDTLALRTDDGSIDVRACLATLLDPGAAPAGTDLLNGTIERL